MKPFNLNGSIPFCSSEGYLFNFAMLGASENQIIQWTRHERWHVIKWKHTAIFHVELVLCMRTELRDFPPHKSYYHNACMLLCRFSFTEKCVCGLVGRLCPMPAASREGYHLV
jgi:hypothetical protein